MRSLAKGLAAATLVSVACLAPWSASAQQRATMQQRAAPPPPPAGQGLASPEIKEQDEARCPGFRVFVTLRGVAFACSDFKAQEHFVMVVTEDQYPGAGQAAVALLSTEIEKSYEYIMDPQKMGSRLRVRHRDAGTAARAVCAMTRQVRPNTPCREVINLRL